MIVQCGVGAKSRSVPRNYTKINDTVLDPFAGGSVRGLAAGCMRRYYIGVDIRDEQVQANKKQRTSVMPKGRNPQLPDWFTGDR